MSHIISFFFLLKDPEFVFFFDRKVILSPGKNFVRCIKSRYVEFPFTFITREVSFLKNIKFSGYTSQLDSEDNTSVHILQHSVVKVNGCF